MLSLGLAYYLRLPTDFCPNSTRDEHQFTEAQKHEFRKKESARRCEQYNEGRSLDEINNTMEWGVGGDGRVNLRQQFKAMVDFQAKAMNAQNNPFGFGDQKQVPWNDLQEVLEDEMSLYLQNAQVPNGIAFNEALKENFFSIVVCVQTRTPLIINGPPGCSKTLSFKIAQETMRGDKSQSEFFRFFVAIHGDVFHYQCSEHSTSNEIKTVFDRAIERQYEHIKHRSVGRRSGVLR
jgi:hypothetical protein